jgi:hypothetical protein
MKQEQRTRDPVAARGRTADPNAVPSAPRRVPDPSDATLYEAVPGTAVLTVGTTEPSEHLFRRLLGAYLAGAPEFVIRERGQITPSTREVVRTFCRRTRQPEIVSDEGNLLRLHDLAYESPVSLDQRIQRMGRLVVGLHREAVESWSNLPLGDDGYWERRDDEVDREAWYIQRIAALRLNADRTSSDLLGPWTVARSLERIADHAAVLGVTGQRLVSLPQGAGPTHPLRQFHAQAMAHLEGALAATDGDQANELLDTGEALMTSGHSLADRLLSGVGAVPMPPATAATLARILESIGRTIAYAQDIAQVVLDRSVPVALPPSAGPSARASRAGLRSEPSGPSGPGRFLPPAAA